jgi:hypothetical protein
MKSPSYANVPTDITVRKKTEALHQMLLTETFFRANLTP